MSIDVGAVERIRSRHPLQYGLLRDGTIVYETGNDDRPEIVDRFNRCPNCEQWSPCDVRQLLDDTLAQKKGDERIHTLEHALKSYMDFMVKPTIAGDKYEAISTYANMLHARTRKLLGEDDE